MIRVARCVSPRRETLYHSCMYHSSKIHEKFPPASGRGGGQSRAGPCETHVPPHFFGLAQRNGCGAPKKNAQAAPGGRCAARLTNGGYPLVRRASLHPSAAWPTVHCFAYARGTTDHHPVSGASEAKPTAVARLRLEASACGPVYWKASDSEAHSASASKRSLVFGA